MGTGCQATAGNTRASRRPTRRGGAALDDGCPLGGRVALAPIAAAPINVAGSRDRTAGPRALNARARRLSESIDASRFSVSTAAEATGGVFSVLQVQGVAVG